MRAPTVSRDEPGSRESACRALAECLGCLQGIAPCRHRGGVAQIAGYLFQRHPVVDRERRCGMADAVRTKAVQASTAGRQATKSSLRPHLATVGLCIPFASA